MVRTGLGGGVSLGNIRSGRVDEVLEDRGGGSSSSSVESAIEKRRRAPARGPDAPGGVSAEKAKEKARNAVKRTKEKLSGGSSSGTSKSTAKRLMEGSKSTTKKTAERLMQGSLESEADPTLGSERPATVEEKAAAGRKTRDFSSDGVADRFRENEKKVKDAVDNGLQLDPSGEPRTTQVSSGATSITVTNIPDNIRERTIEPLKKLSGKGGSPIPEGGGLGPTPNEIIDRTTTIVNEIEVPKVKIPDINIPTIENPLGGLLGKLKLLGGFLVLLATVYVFGQLFDVQVGD